MVKRRKKAKKATRKMKGGRKTKTRRTKARKSTKRKAKAKGGKKRRTRRRKASGMSSIMAAQQ